MKITEIDFPKNMFVRCIKKHDWLILGKIYKVYYTHPCGPNHTPYIKIYGITPSGEPLDRYERVPIGVSPNDFELVGNK